MQLLDAIFLVGQMPEQSVIYTREPFQLSNEAKIVQFGKDDTVVRHDKEEGFIYFLEAELVAELLEMIASKRSSRETKAEFVCHYSTWEAYPAWASDLEDALCPSSALGRFPVLHENIARLLVPITSTFVRESSGVEASYCTHATISVHCTSTKDRTQ